MYLLSVRDHGSCPGPSSLWCEWKLCCRCAQPAEGESGWRRSSPLCPWCSPRPSGASPTGSAGRNVTLDGGAWKEISETSTEHDNMIFQVIFCSVSLSWAFEIFVTYDTSWSGWGICPRPFGCKRWQSDREGRSGCKSDTESWTQISVPPQSFLLSLEAPDMLAPGSQMTLKMANRNDMNDFKYTVI